MSATKQKLIECAMELFGRNGFHAIGLDAILNEVGVSKQTFYNHFESKDELILAVLELRHQHQVKLFDRLFKDVCGDDPRDQLYGVFDVFNAWFNTPGWRGCIFMNATAEFPAPTDPAHQAAARHLLGMREHLQYLATLAGARNPRETAEQLIVLIEGVIGARHTTGLEHYVEIGRQIGTAMLDRQFDREKATSEY